jgi:hypothetical protein
MMQFMTSEHFTLQTARAVVNAEISARLQLYMTTLWCCSRSSTSWAWPP